MIYLARCIDVDHEAATAIHHRKLEVESACKAFDFEVVRSERRTEATSRAVRQLRELVSIQRTYMHRHYVMVDSSED
jgi:hypothetical protein